MKNNNEILSGIKAPEQLMSDYVSKMAEKNKKDISDICNRIYLLGLSVAYTQVLLADPEEVSLAEFQSAIRKVISNDDIVKQYVYDCVEFFK